MNEWMDRWAREKKGQTTHSYTTQATPPSGAKLPTLRYQLVRGLPWAAAVVLRRRTQGSLTATVPAAVVAAAASLSFSSSLPAVPEDEGEETTS